jgi:hypothetical protein
MAKKKRAAVCLATELPQAGRALRTIRSELPWNALPRLLLNFVEAFMRWLVVISAYFRDQCSELSGILLDCSLSAQFQPPFFLFAFHA